MFLRLSSLAVLALGLGSCCSDPIDGSSYFCLGDMSLDEEVSLGSGYAPIIDAQYDGVYADPQAAQYLGGLIKEMASHSVYSGQLEWNFTILNTSIPNAFAVPGGYVYITRGLLAAMETEGQFISVMGHELGHVEHRHSHRAMGRQALGGVLVGVLGSAENAILETDTGILASVGEAGAGLVLLSYNRGQETQSDGRGIFFAAEMGYDPMEAVKTFEYFQKLEDEAGGGNSIEFLRTHPLNATRIDDIKEQIHTMYPELAGRPQSSFRPYNTNNTQFQQVVARFKSAQPVYDRFDGADQALNQALEADDKAAINQAIQTIEGCANDIPSEPLFPAAAGMGYLGLDQFAKAKSSLQRAVQLDDQYLPDRKLWKPRYFLGVTLNQQGDHNGARDALKSATDAFPFHPAPFYELGIAYEKLGRDSEAVAAYQKVIELEGDPNGALTQKAKTRLDSLK